MDQLVDCRGQLEIVKNIVGGGARISTKKCQNIKKKNRTEVKKCQYLILHIHKNKFLPSYTT